MSSTTEQQKKAILIAMKDAEREVNHLKNTQAQLCRAGDIQGSEAKRKLAGEAQGRADNLMAAISTIEKLERIGALFCELAAAIKPEA